MNVFIKKKKYFHYFGKHLLILFHSCNLIISCFLRLQCNNEIHFQIPLVVSFPS